MVQTGTQRKVAMNAERQSIWNTSVSKYKSVRKIPKIWNDLTTHPQKVKAR